MACDVNTDPQYFRKSLWFTKRCMIIKAPEEGISTCRSVDPKGEPNERTCDYVVASRTVQGKSKNMEVVEGHTMRLLFWWKETRRFGKCVSLKMPQALPVFSGGELPGRSGAESGKRATTRHMECNRVENEVMTAVLTANLVHPATSGAVAGEVQEMGHVDRGPSSVGWGAFFDTCI